uniref:Uncharacterized protein n=1 Tax=Anguilla anguilla TaxID=7936 RepID=A0A0E9WBI7_ANGAN
MCRRDEHCVIGSIAYSKEKKGHQIVQNCICRNIDNWNLTPTIRYWLLQKQKITEACWKYVFDKGV